MIIREKRPPRRTAQVREETPKVGYNIDTQRSMLRCTIYVAVHKYARGRSSQGPHRSSSGQRTATSRHEKARRSAGPLFSSKCPSLELGDAADLLGVLVRLS